MATFSAAARSNSHRLKPGRASRRYRMSSSSRAIPGPPARRVDRLRTRRWRLGCLESCSWCVYVLRTPRYISSVRCFASNFRVLGRKPRGCVRRPKVFPFLPVLLPAKKRAVFPQTEILLIFLFSTPCSGYFDNQSVTDAIRPDPLLLQRSRSKSHTKSPQEYVSCLHGIAGSSLIAKNLHRHESNGSASGQNCCRDGDAHRYCCDPHAIEDTRVERHIRNGVNLRVERNQMVDPRDKRKSIADEEAKKRPRCADGDSLAQKNIANLLAPRAHGP